MLDTQERPPGIDEQYIVATNSSNLTLNPDKICAATHLIAAGLLGNRMGEALAHLRAEWDAADKPRRLTGGEIARHAATLPKRQGKPDIKRAAGEAALGYKIAMRKRMWALRGRPVALRIMLEWAEVKRVDPEILAPTLDYWLAPTCPACDGHGARKIEDAPALSAKRCHHCEGRGTITPPHDAYRVLDWLKSCAAKAKRDRAALLYAGR